MGVFDNFEKKKPDTYNDVNPGDSARWLQESGGNWKVGDIINKRYEIQQILGGPGKSGMGIVYLCHDNIYSEEVVLKTFQDRFLQDKATIERFKWEAEAWVRLEKHLNIVQAQYIQVIYGRPFIFLEYVVGDEKYGVDLSGWIYNGGLTPLLTLNFAIQFCHGMMYAEKKFREMGKQFVHRDIKPSNILISQDKVLKITDFGLVKAFDESGKDTTIITGGESCQRLGFSKIGNICGTPPYMSPEQCRGEKNIDAKSDIYSFGCVLYEMVTGKPPFDAPIMDGYIYQHLRTIPKLPETNKEMTVIIMKCLEKEPRRRFQDFRELEKELSEFYLKLTGKVVKLAKETKLKAWEWHKKGSSLFTLGLYEEAIICFQQALRLNPKYVSAHHDLGWTYDEQGKLDDAVKEYHEAIKNDPKYAPSHNNLGRIYYKQGKLDDAMKEFREAIKNDPKDTLYHTNLGATYAKKGKLDEGMREYQEALNIDPSFAIAHYNIGWVFEKQGKQDDAMREYREAIRINPNYVEAHYNLALALEKISQEKALVQWKTFLKMAQHIPSQKECVIEARKHIMDLENEPC